MYRTAKLQSSARLSLAHALQCPNNDCTIVTTATYSASHTANVLTVGFGHWRGALLQGDRCDRSVGLIRGAFELAEQNSMIELEMSEFIKADGALTCLSVLLESVHT
jgi:hypothetical protein